MPIEYKQAVAVFEGQCSVEEAEPLYEWLTDNPEGHIDMKSCEHFHTAILQVLLYCKPAIDAFPEGDHQVLMKTLLTESNVA